LAPSFQPRITVAGSPKQTQDSRGSMPSHAVYFVDHPCSSRGRASGDSAARCCALTLHWARFAGVQMITRSKSRHLPAALVAAAARACPPRLYHCRRRCRPPTATSSSSGMRQQVGLDPLARLVHRQSSCEKFDDVIGWQGRCAAPPLHHASRRAENAWTAATSRPRNPLRKAAVGVAGINSMSVY